MSPSTRGGRENPNPLDRKPRNHPHTHRLLHRRPLLDMNVNTRPIPHPHQRQPRPPVLTSAPEIKETPRPPGHRLSRSPSKYQGSCTSKATRTLDHIFSTHNAVPPTWGWVAARSPLTPAPSRNKSTTQVGVGRPDHLPLPPPKYKPRHKVAKPRRHPRPASVWEQPLPQPFRGIRKQQKS